VNAYDDAILKNENDRSKADHDAIPWYRKRLDIDDSYRNNRKEKYDVVQSSDPNTFEILTWICSDLG